ncbi:hypothetical protein [Streptomyces sp. NBC_00102]|uniref:hypothetical protein n=1 Tax=Streptomyces sp. NBC_00102 TaxID=2975652 RepID=UPI002256FC60|nr:hypothetical protein [Streptomyces sp. NBC_00102]MCX5400727.1 hypothetical protein [Streptomyces sp. NBC_00102]
MQQARRNAEAARHTMYAAADDKAKLEKAAKAARTVADSTANMPGGHTVAEAAARAEQGAKALDFGAVYAAVTEAAEAAYSILPNWETGPARTDAEAAKQAGMEAASADRAKDFESATAASRAADEALALAEKEAARV